MSEPTYTWQQIEQALCEIRLETWGLSACSGVTQKDGQLTTRGVISVELQRKLHQLFPQGSTPDPRQSHE